MRTVINICFLFLVVFYSCNEEHHDDKTLFELQSDSGIKFENKVTDDSSDNCFLYRNFYNGGGVATGDLNNDGLADIVFTSNMGSNSVYLNKGGLKFNDITETAGLKQEGMWCTGVTLADINNDGWLDMYICSSGIYSKGSRRNKLYINNHDLTFTEAAQQYGLDYSGYCTQATFLDYDMDGDLDCFIINNSPIPFGSLNYANMRDLPEKDWAVTSNYKGGGNHLLRNDNMHYTEVTAAAGIHTSLISFGLGVSVADINNDGYPDIYVGNDFIERDYLYINQKNGTFKDELEDHIQHTSMSSMSSDIADINNDGYPDIYTTDMLPADDYRLKTTGVFDNIDLYRSKIKLGFYYQYVKNCLQLNNGSGNFSEIANYGGVAATDWSWGSLIFDADNDGFADIYVCNGINHDLSNLDFLDFFSNDAYQKMKQTGKQEDVYELLKRIPQTPLLNKAFKNSGNLQFEDAGIKWGFTQPSFSNAVSYADLDNDGDLDLVVNNENGPAFLYKNNANEITKNHFLNIELKGADKNTFAIGSKIKVYAGKQILTREVAPTRGFQSSVDYKQVFGLGTAAKIDSMVIVWPNRTLSSFVNMPVDTLYVIQQPAIANKLTDSADIATKAIFTLVNNNFDKHTEDDFVDFYYERNIPQMLSHEGPKATTADVNADGLTDIFICGASGQEGQLYLQTANGGFVKKNEKDFDRFEDFEETNALFFDCDKDGDVDLFVGSGGNTTMPSARELQHRLYKNDGHGNFTIDVAAFPANADNSSVAASCDFDNDGDSDLFVGSLNAPQLYGVTPKSHIYINDGNGHYTDMPHDKMNGLDSLGMITSAIWADLNADGKSDLVVTGKWMATHIYMYKNGHFEELKNKLNDLSGMWGAVAVADLNGDGKNDLVLGNLGQNFYLDPTKENPVKIWINDFDGNGFTDKIITNYQQGKDMPVFLKHDMEEQIPSLKKKNLKHEDYAKRSIQDLFSPEALSASIQKQINYAPSCIAINNGKGDFIIKQLSADVQFSCVNSIICKDVNNDGFVDIVTAGNDFDFAPQLQRLDASYGNVLLNDGKGNFVSLSQQKSGLNIRGMVRDIQQLNISEKNYLLFLRNNDKPIMMQY